MNVRIYETKIKKKFFKKLTKTCNKFGNYNTKNYLKNFKNIKRIRKQNLKFFWYVTHT